MVDREFRRKEYLALLERSLEPGAFYEDCRYHPMVCVGFNKRTDMLMGISLIDGKLGQCSYKHCGVRLLTPAEAMRNRIYGLTPRAVEADKKFRKKWVPKKDWKKYLKERKRKQEQGIFFPEANPDDVQFLESSLGKKLQRRW